MTSRHLGSTYRWTPAFATGAVLAAYLLPNIALACDSDNDCKGSRICSAHQCIDPTGGQPPPDVVNPTMPPSGYPPSQPPPPPPPPPPPSYSPAPAYAPPPPPPAWSPAPPPPVRARSWGYLDVGLTTGIPFFYGTDPDGNSFGGVLGGAGFHLDLGFKLSDNFGLGLDFAGGGYGFLDGSSGTSSLGLGRIDLGSVTGGYRFGIGVAIIGPVAGPDIYLGYFWHIAGPFCIGLSADYMWDFGDDASWVAVNVEFGLEFGDR